MALSRPCWQQYLREFGIRLVAWGIGLSQRLYALERQVLAAAGQLVAACTCPACVGPVLEPGRNTKAHVLRLVEAGLG